jgi:hypothetical protein
MIDWTVARNGVTDPTGGLGSTPIDQTGSVTRGPPLDSRRAGVDVHAPGSSMLA